MDLVWITRSVAILTMLGNALTGQFRRLPAGVAATFLVMSFYRPDWKAAQQFEH